ncbi:hypothetical protein AAFX91_32705 [Bradyrhizobium sp. 31Argb]|nr:MULTISPECIES: hypothetical protein [Bradyrhizobium]
MPNSGTSWRHTFDLTEPTKVSQLMRVARRYADRKDLAAKVER